MAGSDKRRFIWGPVIALVILGTVVWNLFPSIARQTEGPTRHFDELNRTEAVLTAAGACDVDNASAVYSAAWSLKLDELRPEEAARHGGDEAASVWRVPKHASMFVRLSTSSVTDDTDEAHYLHRCAVVAANVDHAELLARLGAPDVLGSPREILEPDGAFMYEWPPDKNGAATVRLHVAGESAAKWRDIELEFAMPVTGAASLEGQ